MLELDRDYGKRAEGIIGRCNEVTPIEAMKKKDVDFDLFKERVRATNLN